MLSIIKSIIVLLIFILFGELASAQQKPMANKNQLKFTPLKLVDFLYPALELGYERNFAKRLATQFMAGPIHNLFGTSPFNDLKGHRLSLEHKYKLLNSYTWDDYIGIEFAMLKADFEYWSSYSSGTAPQLLHYVDTFAVKKRTYSLNFKGGLMKAIFTKNLILDMYAGLGVKWKETTRSGVNDPLANENWPRHPNVFHPAIVEGKEFAGNIIVNVRLGYKF